jgi:ribosomal protein S18 acetylase RimI-like enzyme
MNIRPMTIEDYESVLALMRDTPGVSVRAADSPEAIGRYLARNPGLSLVAESDGRLVGCLFCGHDGRRGYLHHVVVHPDYRRMGLGRRMVTMALDGLEAAGIFKSHLEVFANNDGAMAFWRTLGWQRREDIRRFSFNRSTDPNA